MNSSKSKPELKPKKSLNERFVDVADFISYAIGTPANIGFWLFAVFAWIAAGPWISGHNFLPDWFTSNAFNFPLNTVTTLAELYIGFLVAAATNRSEKALKLILNHVTDTVDRDEELEKNIVDLINENTALTKEIHEALATKVTTKGK